MTRAMGRSGEYELGSRLSLTMRDRELVIDRTCARCQREYEWGAHIAFFADRVGLSSAQMSSISHGFASDPCWTDARDRAVIEAVDSLHDNADIDDEVWSRLEQHFSAEQMLDLLMLAGWCHAIS